MIWLGGVVETTGMTSLRALTIIAALLAVSIATIGRPAAAQTSAGELRAVIELFTSQGCSSCPPADRMLSELGNDSSLVTLSLPIDYWDYLGWKDTLALPSHASRQKAYSKIRGDREVYTPQVVVNGVAQALGSDRAEIERAVAQSHAKAAVLTVPVHLAVDADHVTVTLTGLTPPADPAGVELASAIPIHGGEVWLCPLSRSVTVGVGRGENKGRTLNYANVVRRWVRLGGWSGKNETFTVPVDAIKGPGIDAVAVLVQRGTAGVLMGASIASLH
jgi:hypothetical protein